MHRRTVLGAAAASITLAVAGCIENVRNLQFSFPVPISIVNETDDPANVLVEAFSMEDTRQTYEESVNVQPDQTSNLGHLDTEPQRVRITLVDEEVFEEESIGEDAQSLRAVITGDGLEINLETRDDSDDGGTRSERIE